MTLEIIPFGDAQVVLLPQRFDAETAPGIETDLRHLMESAPEKTILDFSRTQYIASAGLRVLLIITRDIMKARRKVVLVDIRPPVMKVFDMAGFTSIFTIAGTREEAAGKMA